MGKKEGKLTIIYRQLRKDHAPRVSCHEEDTEFSRPRFFKETGQIWLCHSLVFTQIAHKCLADIVWKMSRHFSSFQLTKAPHTASFQIN